MAKSMSSSEKTITVGQVAKFSDLLIARLLKSGLPNGPTQYVLEHHGAEIADGFIADVSRRVKAHQLATEPHLLQRRPFEPEQFLGKGWQIDEVVGQRSGDNLDAGKIILKDYLKEGEFSVNGEERLERIKDNPDDVQLDAKDCLALWQEKDHATLKWLYDTRGITFLSFWATILRRPGGDRYVLCLYRHQDGSWNLCYHGVSRCNYWRARDPVAILANPPATPKR